MSPQSSAVISCRLMGGLGNQMFQAAHAYAQGLRHGRPVQLTLDTFTPGQAKPVSHYRHNVFRHFTFVDSLPPCEIVSEGPWEYTDVKPAEGHTVFEGYFQSSRNFLGFDDDIRERFLPPGDVVDPLRQRYPETRGPGTVSLHVRRGDYLRLPEVHPTVGLSYIRRALELIGDYSSLLVFSDDRQWAREHLSLPRARHVAEEEDYLELWLMSLCQHHIICNSSFSWWGSFLNRHPGKRTIAPSLWFGAAGPPIVKDIYQPDWTIVAVAARNGTLEHAA